MNIEIDFDVFKELTSRRTIESISYNDVLRDILGLKPLNEPELKSDVAVLKQGWTSKGVTFPEGTEFRAEYKGQTIVGRVESGLMVVNGKRFDSPSSAAGSITDNSVNGWTFWECRFPGDVTWRLIKSLRE
ncbi:MAG: DUF2924 domain-containing protein [Desulfuromusa sp.]|nr:DUF2924 domain-containing protein [Desulfuromusa sp.]